MNSSFFKKNLEAEEGNSDIYKETEKAHNESDEEIEKLSLVKSDLTDCLENIAIDMFESPEHDITDTENLGDGSDSREEFEASVFKPLIKECSCCKITAGNLIQCDHCNRYFHYDCHIPALANKFVFEESVNFQCILCQDISRFSEIVEQKNMKSSTYIVDKAKHQIMQRILMEFYCQNITDVKFRMTSIRGILSADYFGPYEPYDLSLNVIKYRLETGQSYSSFHHFVTDMKLLFSNAMIYNYPGDHYYNSAECLQNYLKTLITKWIPEIYVGDVNF